MRLQMQLAVAGFSLSFLVACLPEQSSSSSTNVTVKAKKLEVTKLASNGDSQPGVAVAGRNVIEIGKLAKGIAGFDSRKGVGYIMYSEERVHKRFAAHSPHRESASHLALVFERKGRWYFDNNQKNLVFFQPQPTDVLVAQVDLSSQLIRSLKNKKALLYGMRAGYVDGDLEFKLNRWGGKANRGEIGASGSFIVVDSSRNHSVDAISPGNLGHGIPAYDERKGTGYLMYSQVPVSKRFAASQPLEASADHIAVVFYSNGKWFYDSNSSEAMVFTPKASDVLIARVDFDNDWVSSLESVNTTVNGIAAGYLRGDLKFHANEWAGESNAGEFFIVGSYFEPYRERLETETRAVMFATAGE